MSDCVVWMEMPHDGLCDLEQTLIYGLGTYCAVNGERCNYSDTGIRPDYCPILCQLPEGHGRLVSEKDVRWVIDDIVLEIAERIGHVPMTKNETMEYVNRLPTIVPAERREV